MVDQGGGEGEFEIAEKLGEGFTLEADLIADDAGCLARRGGNEDAVTSALPCFDAGFHGPRGLSGPRQAESDAEGTVLLGQVADELHLFLAECGVVFQLSAHRLLRECIAGASGQSIDGGENAAFFSEDSPGCVAGNAVVSAQGDDVGIVGKKMIDFVEDGVGTQAVVGEERKGVQQEVVFSEVVLLPREFLDRLLNDFLDGSLGFSWAVAEQFCHLLVAEAGGDVGLLPLVEQLLAGDRWVFSLPGRQGCS